MMLNKNIDYLISWKRLNHKSFGDLFDLNSSVISTYVRGKAIPKVETIIKISDYFNISCDDLLKKDLSKESVATAATKNATTVATEKNNLIDLLLHDEDVIKAIRIQAKILIEEEALKERLILINKASEEKEKKHK